MAQVSYFLFTRMKKICIYDKGMDRLDFLLNAFIDSVHLGLCIAKCVLSLQLVQVVISICYLSCG
jgi:hypothetical protein